MSTAALPTPALDVLALRCCVPGCGDRRATHGLPLGQLVLCVCAAHAANLSGAAALGVAVRLPDGRQLPAGEPLPLVFGGELLVPGLRAVLPSERRRRRSQRAQTTLGIPLPPTAPEAA